MAESNYGQQTQTDGNSGYNSTAFQIREALGNVRTGVSVKVIAVHGGGVAAAPTVDLQPMVNQTDGIGDKTDHGIVYGVPVQRSQGGSAAIINDPKVGDIGYMTIADRDISALKSNEGAQSNPGSGRRHSMSDGVYVGAMLNPAIPDRYLNLNGPGINWTDEFGNTIISGASGILLNGVLITREGKVTAPDDVIANPGNISLVNHVNSGVIPGGGNSGPPVGS